MSDVESHFLGNLNRMRTVDKGLCVSMFDVWFIFSGLPCPLYISLRCFFSLPPFLLSCLRLFPFTFKTKFCACFFKVISAQWIFYLAFCSVPYLKHNIESYTPVEINWRCPWTRYWPAERLCCWKKAQESFQRLLLYNWQELLWNHWPRAHSTWTTPHNLGQR